MLVYMGSSNELINSGSVDAGAFVPDVQWWTHLIASIDSGDAETFVKCLTPDASFRFANAPQVVGSAAIRDAVAGFFSAIASSHHEIKHRWHGENSVVCEGEVTYTRHDGTTITCPFVNVFELRETKIAAYRIYIDNSLLFAETH